METPRWLKAMVAGLAISATELPPNNAHAQEAPDVVASATEPNVNREPNPLALRLENMEARQEVEREEQRRQEETRRERLRQTMVVTPTMEAMGDVNKHGISTNCSYTLIRETLDGEPTGETYIETNVTHNIGGTTIEQGQRVELKDALGHDVRMVATENNESRLEVFFENEWRPVKRFVHNQEDAVLVPEGYYLEDGIYGPVLRKDGFVPETLTVNGEEPNQ